MKPRHLRFGMNLWPPFLGAGIHVRHIAEDWSEVIVDLRHGLMNRNYAGTHYGGSIEFVAPGRGTARAVFRLTREEVEAIRAQAVSGEKVLPAFDVEVRDADNALVARVHKTLYVRLKPRYRP
jgi:hypothetical protein